MPRLSPKLFAAGALLVAPLTTADLLLTRDGSTIETQGPWKVKGRQVIFTSEKGALSSLRVEDVDLEASEEATRRALEPPAPPAEVEVSPPEVAKEAVPKAAIEINNDNLGRVARSSGRDEVAAVSQSDQTAESLGEVGEQMGRLMADLGRGMAEGMAQMAEDFGGDEAAAQEFVDEMDDLGDQMTEGMAKGMEAVGEVMVVMAQLAPRVATMEQQFDLETPEGIRAAAPGLAELARFLRSQTSKVSPEAAEMLTGIASQMEEVAELARTNPEEALKRRREMKAAQEP